MLPQQAFDKADRPLGRVIGMDLDAKGQPKGYVILLEGDAAETLMGASRGLLVVPANEADVRERAPAPEAAGPEAVLILRNAMERLKRGWNAAAPRAEDEDPSAW